MLSDIVSDLKDYFKNIPLNAIMGLLTYFIMMFGVCMLLSDTWNTRMDYSFGYIAPVFAIFILYDRRKEILSFYTEYEPITSSENKILKVFCDILFGGMLFCGMLTFLIFAFIYFLTGNRGAPGFGTAFGYSFVSFALAYLASAYDKNGNAKPILKRLKFTALFTFPCFIWLLAAPTFNVVEEEIKLKLLSMVAIVVQHVMDFFGYVVELRGNTISFPKGSVGVAEACSGIRSLTACLFAGSFLATVFLNKLWKKITMVFASMCCAFLNNLIRALFLGIWAYENGPDSISGTVHDTAGYIILFMTVVELMMLLPIFQLNPIPPEFREEASREKENA